MRKFVNPIKVAQGVNDFRKGLNVLINKPTPGDGDRKLANISMILESQINPLTADYVRKGVIKDIEKTLYKTAKKGGQPAVDEKVTSSLATPEYMRMLERLGLGEPHVRLMATEALQKAGKLKATREANS